MVRSSVVTSIHYLARAILMAGFAFYIVQLVRSGNLDLYIAARMQFIVKLSALGLYAVAAQQFYSAIRTWFDRIADSPSCDCNHEMPATWVKSLLLYGWFALPLALGFMVPDGLLGSSMASAKGMQFAPQKIVKPASDSPSDIRVPLETSVPSDGGSSAVDKDNSKKTDIAGASPSAAVTDTREAEALNILFPSDQFTESYAKFGKKLVTKDVISIQDKQFIETLTTIDLFRTAFIGKTIQLSGFVYRENAMNKQQFGVSRFAISCCSADASPYGVMVKFDKANSFKTDEWVTVTGKLSTTLYNGNEIIQIDVDKMVKISPLENPYVTPDLDFGLEDMSISGG